ncbi:MAG TPA: hypothetical protein VHC72_12085 [Bryobacteraceae bacterium]|nr:hypothetical protein [Bryobacteraceae bacterium]
MIRTTLAVLVLLSCAGFAGSADLDHDGLGDDFEQALLHQFAPVFHISADDCAGMPAEFVPDSTQPVAAAANGTIYGQVFRSGPYIEIHYYHLWAKDCGSLGHGLDAEHVSALLSAQDTSRALYWFAAAHQATVCELNSGSSAAALHAEEHGPDVWVSEGKHASFLTSNLCGKGCGADSCKLTRQLQPTRIVNIGEPGAPMNGAVWVNSPAWPMAAKMTTDFDSARLEALNASGGELVLFQPSPPTQAVISGLGAGPRYTAGALGTAGAHTDSALDTAERHTRKSLDASRRSVINFLSGGKKKSTSK